MTDGCPVVLITGAARRIGAETARCLHAAGYNLVLHYHHSTADAHALAEELNTQRKESARLISANLNCLDEIKLLATQATAQWSRIDVLINNASTFYPTPIGQVTEALWDDLMGSNLKAPFFLSQALAEELKKTRGCIINIADIHALRPLPEHSVYCVAKAGNIMLTQTLARELGPEVRVNGVAPGAILWPEQQSMSDSAKENILQKIPLQRRGSAADIARTILFLVKDAPYITGQILPVDGGRSIYS